MQSSHSSPLCIAQMSDSHLFADKNGLHCGVNVYQNLLTVLADIATREHIDYVVFTGDLSQDHTACSYENFANAVYNADINIPVLYLAGNHDEHALLDKYLVNLPFSSAKSIENDFWQVQLINSKSDTPAGYVQLEQLNKLDAIEKHQLLFMHHHPVDVGYFIDRHGLENKDEFWQVIANATTIKGIACGHVHSAGEYAAYSQQRDQSVPVFTCPATSIQFDPNIDGVSALPVGPGYRLFNLFADGTLQSEAISL